MTEDDVKAIIAAIAPIVRELRESATQRGDALAAQVRTLETRNTELEVRAAALETRCHLLEFEMSTTTVRP